MFKNILFMLVLFFSCSSFALTDNLYSAIVPVENQSESQRLIGFAVALQKVANQLNETQAAGHTIDFSKPLEHPEQYVERFSYSSDPDQNASLEMYVHFDEQSLKAFLPEQKALITDHLNLQIIGIDSLAKLNAAQDELAHLAHVKSVLLNQVSADKVDVTLVFQGNIVNVMHSLMSNQHLQVQDSDREDQSHLLFQWIE